MVTLCICVDPRMGFSFMRKRQGYDKNVVSDIFSDQEQKVFMTTYSTSYVSKCLDLPAETLPENGRVFKDMKELETRLKKLKRKKKDAKIFLENTMNPENEEAIRLADMICFYIWDETYPTTVRFFDPSTEPQTWLQQNETTFEGSSHKEIIKKEWRRIS